MSNDLIVTPHPLTLEGRVMTRAAELLPGEALTTFLGRNGVDLSQPGWHIIIGGAQVPEILWGRTRPQHGQVVEVRRQAGKDTVKDIARIAAIATLAYFTIVTGGLTAPLNSALGFTAGSFGAYAVNTAAFVLGSMVINRVLAPSALGGRVYEGQTGSTYSLQGARNRARLFEPLGLLFGQVRVSPDFGAQPYAYFESDEQYQYLRLHAGVNCASVADIEIGETAITAYEGVTVQQTGFPGGPVEMLNWGSVDSVAGGLLDAVTAPGAWVTRTTSVGTGQISVDIVAQLYSMADNGAMQTATATFEAEFRSLPAGTGPQPAWTALFASPITLTSSSTKPVRRTFTQGVDTAQYEVRLRKTTVNATGTRQANVIEWTALKSYQYDTTDYAGQPQVGIKIKASGQLQGVLDQVSWLATSEASPLWNGSAWVTTTTSNPGAHMLRFIRGIYAPSGRLMAGMGKPDDQIDLDSIKAFMLHCTAKGYRFDHWFDARASCGEVLEAMAAAGLGAVSYHAGKLGVVWADAGQPIEAVLSPVRMKPGTFRVDYATRELADELEVTWPERTNNWLPASVRVLAPGVTTPRETARLSPVGVTTQAGGLLAARFTMAQNIYQRKAVSWEMDLEHLAFNRYSMVALSHDVTQWGYSGRLHAAALNRMLWSDDLRDTGEAGSSRPWSELNGADVEVALVSATDPAGGTTVSKLRCSTTGQTTRQTTQTFACADNEVVCISFHAKAAEVLCVAIVGRTKSLTYPQISVDLLTGTVTHVVGSVIAHGCDDAGGGWWRLWLAFDVGVGANTPYGKCMLQGAGNVHYSGAVGDGVLLWGAMANAGAAPGPLAHTTTATAVAVELDMEVPAVGADGATTRYVALHIPGESGYRVFGVQAFSGNAHTLTLTGAWPGGVPLPGDSAGNPAHDTVWVYDFNAAPGLRMRVVNIEPTANLGGARITAVPEGDEFWTYVTSGAYTAPPVGAGRQPVVASGLTVTQELLILTTEYATELSISFDATGPYDHAQVWGGPSGEALQLLGETRTTRLSGWRVSQGAVLSIEVRPFDELGRAGTVAATTYTVAFEANEPLTPTGLTWSVQPFGVQLKCNKNAEPIVVGYEWRTGSNFDTGTVLDRLGGTSYGWEMQVAGSYTVWVAAVDIFGTRGPAASVVVTLTAPTIGSLTAAVTGPDLQLDYVATPGSFAIGGYEIRHGATYAGGTSVGLVQLTRHVRRVDWAGDRRWWVAPVDVNGNVGAAASVDVSIAAPGAVTATRSEVVDNNALLYWAPPASGTLPVERYEVRKGASWAGGETVGSNGNSTFTTIFEQQAGVYSYWVAAVDSAGNEGPAVAIVATINQPPDYVLRDDYNDDFTTPSPTLSGMYVEGGKVYGPALGETIQTHFESRSWASIDAQMTAGYPLVFQPGGTSGYYERTMDYGTVLPASIITVTAIKTDLAGAVTMTAQVSYKELSGDAWTDATSGATQVMAADFRYVKVRLTFTASGGDDLAELSALNIKISGKLLTDSGNQAAVSTDSGGTTVNFTVDFIDVRSIVVTPAGTTARYGIYDFVDVPNPTSFKVLLFDSAGARVSGDFSWTARGFG